MSRKRMKIRVKVTVKTRIQSRGRLATGPVTETRLPRNTNDT